MITATSTSRTTRTMQATYEDADCMVTQAMTPIPTRWAICRLVNLRHTYPRSSLARVNVRVGAPPPSSPSSPLVGLVGCPSRPHADRRRRSPVAGGVEICRARPTFRAAGGMSEGHGTFFLQIRILTNQDRRRACNSPRSIQGGERRPRWRGSPYQLSRTARQTA